MRRGMRLPAHAPLPIFDKPGAWADYDATARTLPDCEHNRAWAQNRRIIVDGQPEWPQPPDCEHNRAWRAQLSAAWVTYLAALDNERGAA